MTSFLHVAHARHDGGSRCWDEGRFFEDDSREESMLKGIDRGYGMKGSFSYCLRCDADYGRGPHKSPLGV